MTSVSRLLQDNFCGKNSWKSIKYSQSYDTVCQLAPLGFKGLMPTWVIVLISSLRINKVSVVLKGMVTLTNF